MNSQQLSLVILICSTVVCWNSFADAHSKLIKEKAEQTNRALLAGDYAKVADFTHPRLVQSMGGRAKMVAEMQATMKEMKAQGVQFRSATIADPSDVVMKNSELFAIVPFSLVVSVPQGMVTQKLFMIATSIDKGRTWTFVDGGNVDPRTLKDLLPNFPPNLKLPARQEPVLQKKQ